MTTPTACLRVRVRGDDAIGDALLGSRDIVVCAREQTRLITKKEKSMMGAKNQRW
jgi:hypothetical protein